MKKRILCVGEYTKLSTGYAVYGHELLSRLYNSGKYDIAELSCYCFPDDTRIGTIPWKIYPNMFNRGNKEEENIYQSNYTYQFGAWKFEDVCIDFKPDVVLEFRDYWYGSFVDNSPFRNLFKWVWMPTVDSFPLNEQWLDTYSRVDRILSYTDFGKDVIDFQSGGNIKVYGVPTPSADSIFKPVEDRAKHKQQHGLPKDCVIFGTVMRNQQRKLFPNLFDAFREFLDRTNKRNVYLYCHTSYPDNNSWDIPELLKYYKLSSKVLFTYMCDVCKSTFPTYFQDGRTICPVCNSNQAQPANVQLGVDSKVLCDIYNLFDGYIQYSNSESPGMTQVEAACCGVPVISTYYSGMQSIIDGIEGFGVNNLSYQKDIATGCFKAVPNNEDLIDIMQRLCEITQEERHSIGLKCEKLAREKYNWDNVANIWMSSIDSLPNNNGWSSPPRLKSIPQSYPNNMPNSHFIKWLIFNVLQDSTKINSYFEAKLLKDLNYGFLLGGISAAHVSDESHLGMTQNQPEKFTQQEAYNLCCNLANHWNHWEKKRCNLL